MNDTNQQLKLTSTFQGVFALLFGVLVSAVLTTAINYVTELVGAEAGTRNLIATLILIGLSTGCAIGYKLTQRWQLPLIFFAVALGILALLAVYYHDLAVWLDALAGSAGSRWLAAIVLISLPAMLAAIGFAFLSVIRQTEPASSELTMPILLTISVAAGAALGAFVMNWTTNGPLGLPGSMFVSSIGCGVIALVAWVAHHKCEIDEQLPTKLKLEEGTVELLTVAVFTSLLGFICLPLLIRVLELIFGSTERVADFAQLAVLIAIGIGGLLALNLSQRANQHAVIARTLFLMGAAIAAVIVNFETIVSFADSLRFSLSSYENSYQLFGAGIFVVALLVLVAMAGISLTLCLIIGKLTKTSGDLTFSVVMFIGLLGAAVGMFGGNQLLLPVVGIQLGVAIVVAGLLILGCWTLVKHDPAKLKLGAVFSGLIIIAVFARAPFDNQSLEIRHYFAGIDSETELVNQNIEIVSYGEDSNSSVGVLAIGPLLALQSRGAIYASQRSGVEGQAQITDDEMAQLLAALLPLAKAPATAKAAVLGLGGGLSTTTLLHSGAINKIDIVEPEAQIIAALPELGVLASPILNDDRKTLHQTNTKQFIVSQPAASYDLIIANSPASWLAGATQYYTTEHFAKLRRLLTENGVLLQRIRLRQNSIQQVASIVEGLSESFPSFEWYLYGNQLFILTLPAEIQSTDLFTSQPNLARLAANYGIFATAELTELRVGGEQLLLPALRSLQIPASSNYFPIIEDIAKQDFHTNNQFDLHTAVVAYQLVFNNELLPSAEHPEQDLPLNPRPDRGLISLRAYARAVLTTQTTEDFLAALSLATANFEHEVSYIGGILDLPIECENEEQQLTFTAALQQRLVSVEPFLPVRQRAILWNRIKQEIPCVQQTATNPRFLPIYMIWESFANQEYEKVVAYGKRAFPPDLVYSYGEQQALLKLMLAEYSRQQFSAIAELSRRVSIDAHSSLLNAVRVIASHALQQHIDKQQN